MGFVDLTVLVRGVLIGFSIAAPVGPIGMLCIRRTLADGRLAGLLSGLGAATADALYGAIAGFGLTAISHLLVSGQMWLRLLGGLSLCYLGIKTLRARPAQAALAGRRGGLLGMYLSTLALTLANPTTILSFVGVFAGLGVVATAHAGYATAALLVGGVFAGSALWWLLLSGAVGLLHERLASRSLGWVNALSGTIITCFGIVALLGLRAH